MKSLTLKGPTIAGMDIQAEKLLLIEQLLQVKDARVIEQVRELLKNENVKRQVRILY